MPDDEIGVRLRLRDARRFQSDAGGVTRSIDGIGSSAERAASRASHAFSRIGSGARTALSAIGSGARYAVGGLAAIGVATATAGVKFNATMEQNQVAFANFLGSADAARKHLRALTKMAATTPFELPDLVNGSKRLLAFGMNARQSNKWLATIGDTAGGLGVGGEGIDRMVAAIGQIQTKGKLSTEELMQLAEQGVPAFDMVAKGTGRSMDQLFSDLQAGTIASDDALDALSRGMRKKFGGMAVAQSKTLTGQWSTLKDNLRGLSGQMMEPLSDALTNRVLPATNKAVQAFQKGFSKKGGLGGLEGGIRALDDMAGAGGRAMVAFYWIEARITNAWGAIKAFVAGWREFSDLAGQSGLAGGINALDQYYNLGGRLNVRFFQLRDIANTLREAWNSWRERGGPGKTMDSLRRSADGASPVLGAIWALLQNPAFQKVAAGAIAAGAAFKVANAATGGLLGSFGRTTLEGVRLTTAIVGLVAQIVAHRTAQLGSTAATNASATASIRERIAKVAGAVATRAMAAAQRVLNIAMRMNPIGLVITGLFLLAVGLVAAYKKFAWFRNLVNGVWSWLKTAAGDALGFVVDKFGWLVGAVGGIPGKLKAAASGMWDFLKDSFRSVINWVIGAWNSFQITIDIPDKIPGLPDAWTLATPDLPLLASGGVVNAPGSVLVGERGPEILSLPRAARVDPLPLALPASAGPGGETVVHANLFLDGQIAAQTVVRAAADQKARA